MSIARTVSGSRKLTSHAFISNELNWPSLSDRREYKIVNNETPQYLQTLIPEKIGTKRAQSRNNDNFYTMQVGVQSYRSSFILSFVRLYYSLALVDRSLEYASSL